MTSKIKPCCMKLSEVSILFELNCENQTLCVMNIGLPEAGAISSILSLCRQAKSPIIQFHSKGQSLMSGFVNTVERRYLSFANRIDISYSDMLKSRLEDDCIQVQACLKEAIIKSEKDLSCSSIEKFKIYSTTLSILSIQEHLFVKDNSVYQKREKRFGEMGFIVSKDVLNIV